MHWADAIIVATPIRWGAASSLYFKMAERLNCVQNSITIRNQVLIRNKVAGFIIVGGQDNIQGVAGQMLGFFAELGFIFPQFPYVAHSRGWSSEDMERNVEIVRESEELAEGASMLAKRCIDLAAEPDRAGSGANRNPARRPQGPSAGDGASTDDGGRSEAALGPLRRSDFREAASAPRRRPRPRARRWPCPVRPKPARASPITPVLGEALVAARPRPARAGSRISARAAPPSGGAFSSRMRSRAHQIGRQRQHDRGLVLAGVDFRNARVRHRAHHRAEMQRAEIKAEVAAQFPRRALPGCRGCRHDR